MLGGGLGCRRRRTQMTASKMMMKHITMMKNATRNRQSSSATDLTATGNGTKVTGPSLTVVGPITGTQP